MEDTEMCYHMDELTSKNDEFFCLWILLPMNTFVYEFFCHWIFLPMNFSADEFFCLWNFLPMNSFAYEFCLWIFLPMNSFAYEIFCLWILLPMNSAYGFFCRWIFLPVKFSAYEFFCLWILPMDFSAYEFFCLWIFLPMNFSVHPRNKMYHLSIKIYFWQENKTDHVGLLILGLVKKGEASLDNKAPKFTSHYSLELRILSANSGAGLLRQEKITRR